MPSNTKNLFHSNEEEEEAFRLAAQLASSSAISMTLKVAIELDILEIIKKSEPASASELASRLPTTNPEAASMIDRILVFLAAHSILTCTPRPLPGGEDHERQYCPTPMCKFLTKNEDGVSLAPCVSFFPQDRIIMETWYHLKDAVLDGGVAFNRAHGMSVFEYPAVDQRFNKVLNRAMSEPSTIFMKKILKEYDGFEDLELLVDVGGGIGASLKMILSKHPSIKGINFDLPYVIEHGLSHPGMEHVGGDIFVSVPKADAIFMKSVLHDWSDEHCKKLLKNCYEALPENGKVIVADFMFLEDTNIGTVDMQTVQLDMFMMCFNSGGKERTEKEFQALAEYAGFKGFIKVCRAYHFWIMEFHK